MGLTQARHELITIGRDEAEAPPERPGSPAEQPGVARALLARGRDGKLGQRSAAAPGAVRGIDGHAADEHVAPIGTELVSRRSHHAAGVVSLDPQSHARFGERAEGEVDVAEEVRQLTNAAGVDTFERQRVASGDSSGDSIHPSTVAGCPKELVCRGNIRR